MKIDIYRSEKNSGKYLSVPAGTDVTKLAVPVDFDQDLRSLSPFKSEHEIIAGKPYIALDSDDVLQQIDAKGFATHGAKVAIEILSAP